MFLIYYFIAVKIVKYKIFFLHHRPVSVLNRISFLCFISENVSHSQIASSPFLRDDNKIPNFTPPQIEEKDKSNSSLSTAGESDANDVSIMVCLYVMKERKSRMIEF